jgi:hypothetical protein
MQEYQGSPLLSLLRKPTLGNYCVRYLGRSRSDLRHVLLQNFEAIFGQYFEWPDHPNIARLNIDQILPLTSSNTIDFSGGLWRYLVNIPACDVLGYLLAEYPKYWTSEWCATREIKIKSQPNAQGQRRQLRGGSFAAARRQRQHGGGAQCNGGGNLAAAAWRRRDGGGSLAAVAWRGRLGGGAAAAAEGWRRSARRRRQLGRDGGTKINNQLKAQKRRR